MALAIRANSAPATRREALPAEKPALVADIAPCHSQRPPPHPPTWNHPCVGSSRFDTSKLSMICYRDSSILSKWVLHLPAPGGTIPDSRYHGLGACSGLGKSALLRRNLTSIVATGWGGVLMVTRFSELGDGEADALVGVKVLRCADAFHALTPGGVLRVAGYVTVSHRPGCHRTAIALAGTPVPGASLRHAPMMEVG